MAIFDSGIFDSGIYDVETGEVAAEAVTTAGYPPKKRKAARVVREPSPWEYSWQRREREARESYERLKAVEPKAEELEPPKQRPLELARVDLDGLKALELQVELFALEERRKRAVRRALEQYQAALKAWWGDLEAQAAEAIALREAAEALEAAIAIDDEDVVMAYLERRRRIAAAAVALVQARMETVH